MNPQNPDHNRLGMTLIVRDESDIVLENIKYHACQGVDAFAVLDNGSTDGTYEILEQARSSFDLLLFRDGDGFRKEERSLFLATEIKQRLGASHLISNDADEFWLPQGITSLKHLISESTPVLKINRFNFILGKSESGRPDYRFYHSINLVSRPLGLQPAVLDPSTPLSFPMALRTMPGKIFCSLEGLHHISKGNHSVVHEAGAPSPSDAAIILHYPIRSYEQFLRKVSNHSQSLWQGPQKQSWHLKRWAEMIRRDILHDEYEELTLSDASLDYYRCEGVIREEKSIFNFFT